MTVRQAVRQWEAALLSLADAEALATYLAAGDQTNAYVAQATERARDLVTEMEENLADVQDRWTPEECGLP